MVMLICGLSTKTYVMCSSELLLYVLMQIGDNLDENTRHAAIFGPT